MRPRLDVYEKFPYGMREYFTEYGWHFSKKLAEWAVSRMEGRNGERIAPKDKSEVESLLKDNGVDYSKMEGYDMVYVEAMARSDYFGSSIKDSAHLALFIGDYLNDKDGYEGVALTRFYSDCIGKGYHIYWEDMV